MQERLLHFIWQHQYFDSFNLKTSTGDPVQVIRPGMHNTNRGPDFLNAELLIRGLNWRGSVELHVDASQWDQHGHQSDPLYNNVILHVTWTAGAGVQREDGSSIPALSLQERTPTRILEKYAQLMSGLPHIPCIEQVEEVEDYSFYQALDTQLRRRMEMKARKVLALWHRNNNDWDKTSFEWLTRHFGFGINNESFEILADSLDLKLLFRHRDRIVDVEALIFGMAGFLEQKRTADDYHTTLKNEFQFLRYKYGLKPRIHDFEWKFLRLRPSNFPTVRLAQLSALISRSDNLFHTMLDNDVFLSESNTRPSSYWQSHYNFGKKRKFPHGGMGLRSRNELMMNTILPLHWAYTYSKGDHFKMGEIFTRLYRIPAERNRITRLWDRAGVDMKTALDSQSYLALFKHQCSRRKCLDCPVGINLLKRI
ncbi:DUF2851 family protein [Fulvivirga sedimenti]|uniref:DUF2851 family protein n=1 Tax=Fulvivirga sedimenti TaxID=2879465 RepID=A0A9X1HND7_9BACT|nr:DUF2851 family protein [Fulvivirga sedimenti]MCA6074003.1 DUF2851 family protein [Fulvivirga sedimenti]